MSIVEFKPPEAQHQAEAVRRRSLFARKVDEARVLMAAMEAQYLEIQEALAKSRKTVEECRALLRETEDHQASSV